MLYVVLDLWNILSACGCIFLDTEKRSLSPHALLHTSCWLHTHKQSHKSTHSLARRSFYISTLRFFLKSQVILVAARQKRPCCWLQTNYDHTFTFPVQLSSVWKWNNCNEPGSVTLSYKYYSSSWRSCQKFGILKKSVCKILKRKSFKQN